MLVLALSGGIDSAVAARLLTDRGFDVHGLFLKHRYQREPEDDARTVADHLGIPLTVLDVSDRFEEIVEHFTDEYFFGRTPNPCVRCNRSIKFGILYDYAIDRLGAEGFATGHYVRRGEVDGFPALFRGLDPAKDQSYVLYGIDRNKLARLHFPLGEMLKSEVREIAEKIDLPIREKKESQDICFVENGRHAEFLHARRPDAETSGNFVAPDGRFLALHSGFEQFTVGQRKGMGVGFGKRVFVLRVDSETKNVVIGSWDELARDELTASDVRWLLPETPTRPFRCGVKIRYRCQTASGVVIPCDDGTVRVRFDDPQHGVAPGQSAVFYFDDRVIGGGVIDEPESSSIS